MKTAIYGISGFGNTHYELLLDAVNQKRLEATAAIVINPEDVPDKVDYLRSIGCRIYPSAEAMWSDGIEIDFCMIPTSISSHVPYAMEAIERGAHVFVEKPLSGCFESGCKLISAAKKRDRHLMVGFQDLYASETIEIKRSILSGELGAIKSIRCIGSWPRSLKYFTRNSWAGRLRTDDGWVLDSPVNNAMAHFLMLMVFWAGRSEREIGQLVSLRGNMYRAQPIESFDTGCLHLKTIDNLDIFYFFTHSSETKVEPKILIEGEKGSIEWTHCRYFEKRVGSDLKRTNIGDLDKLYRSMFSTMIDVLEGKSWAWAVTGDIAIEHTKIVNALMETGPIVDIPEKFLQSKKLQGEDFVFSPKILPALEEAYEAKCLLKDVGFLPSQVPSKSINLSTYSGFLEEPSVKLDMVK